MISEPPGARCSSPRTYSGKAESVVSVSSQAAVRIKGHSILNKSLVPHTCPSNNAGFWSFLIPITQQAAHLGGFLGSMPPLWQSEEHEKRAYHLYHHPGNIFCLGSSWQWCVAAETTCKTCKSEKTLCKDSVTGAVPWQK